MSGNELNSEVTHEALLLDGVKAAKAGRLSEAAQLWWQLIGQQPAGELLSQAWFNLALLCRKSDDLAAAETCLRNALDADTGNHEAREQLANLLAETDKSDEAMQLMAQLVREDPSARHHFNLALLLSKCGRREEAEAQYRAGLSLDPDHANTLRNLGLLLSESGDSEEALECLRRAAASAPNNAEIFSNLGVLLEADSQLETAMVCLRRALELAPHTAVTHCDLGVLYAELGKVAEAEACFLHAEKLDPAYVRAQFCRAHLLLASGRYAEGWRLHEQRFLRAEKAGKPLLEKLPIPQWRGGGESLQGKQVLLHQEQGFGDEIQFARYYPELKRLGATHVALVCKPALAPLLEGIEGVDEVVGTEQRDCIVGRPDYWTSAMSLPHFCNLPAPRAALPYLSVPPQARQRWQRWRSECAAATGANARLKVGLLWQGNTMHSNDKHRSLANIEVLAPLWQVPGVSFYSLQREFVETSLPLQQPGVDIGDFADAAAVIDALDLLISVDSAYAHLAGALAKPVWVLLPARNTDWRWLYGRDDTPWYPGVMRLFRQRQRQRWDEVVAEMSRAFAALAKLPAAN